ncbi:PLP-dependent aminotransferase family protein [Phragmitibacter flavus]|uniref:PLP-dependent aminotransferase family protein n=1 Tax=Phragmitibacter flavus TaxID=2576071 RepID=A0A5R8KJT9_9BACT|nr:PLP-dependent aminotransferase family protein [Phragmitibacter flavus]TLD71879.1 PLP-dependent aminotransferase family protein [Phragmitibacter flavus]
MHSSKSHSADAPLYLQLADRLQNLIKAGTFKPGDRIPSVRHLSAQHHVSIPTVLQAYVTLEDRRLIEARPKSGYFVRADLDAPLRPSARSRRQLQPKSLAQFPPLMSLVHDVANPNLVPMGGANPSADLLPGTKLARITAAIARSHTKQSISYDPVPGCPALREQLSRRSLDWGCALSPDDFIITNGATEALHLALSVTTQPGDTVLIESPTYYGVLTILSHLKLRAIGVPTCPQRGLDLNAAKKILSRDRVAAIVVMPNFNNPLGSLMPDSNRSDLLALAAQHQIPIIEDDIYGDLQHHGERPATLKSLDKNHQVLLCGSFSKTLAPGYRVGYLSASRYQDKIIQLKTAQNFCSAPLPALTIAEFLKNGGYDHHLRTLRNAFHHQVTQMRETLLAQLPSDTHISEPTGGFVLWVELPKKVDTLALFHQAREAGISIAPGHLFSPAAEFKHHLRISCGHPWNPAMEKAVAQLTRMIHHQLR